MRNYIIYVSIKICFPNEEAGLFQILCLTTYLFTILKILKMDIIFFHALILQ